MLRPIRNQHQFVQSSGSDVEKALRFTSLMNDRVCKRYCVSGRVQGVFFRASTADTARRLGVNGWALNLPDGRVEVVATGPRTAVEDLGHWLLKGPRLANVTRVDGDNMEADQSINLDPPPGAVRF